MRPSGCPRRAPRPALGRSSAPSSWSTSSCPSRSARRSPRTRRPRSRGSWAPPRSPRRRPPRSASRPPSACRGICVSVSVDVAEGVGGPQPRARGGSERAGEQAAGEREGRWPRARRRRSTDASSLHDLRAGLDGSLAEPARRGTGPAAGAHEARAVCGRFRDRGLELGADRADQRAPPTPISAPSTPPRRPEPAPRRSPGAPRGAAASRSPSACRARACAS